MIRDDEKWNMYENDIRNGYFFLFLMGPTCTIDKSQKTN